MEYFNLKRHVSKAIHDALRKSEYEISHAETEDERMDAIDSASRVVNKLFHLMELIK